MLSLLFSFLAILAILSYNMQKRVCCKILFCIMFIIYVLSFIRWESGTDWENYYSYFINANARSEAEMEYGYHYLNKLCRGITDSYSFLLFVVATCIFYLLYPIFVRTEYPLLTYLLFYSSTFGYLLFVRQSLAVAIILFSYIFIYNKRSKPFFICVLLASTIHISSLAALPIYYLYNKKIKFKYIFIAFIILLLYSIYFSSTNFLRNFPLANDYLLTKINIYLDYAEYGKEDVYAYSSTQSIIRHLLKRVFLIIPIVLFYRKGIVKDLKFRGYLNIYIYSSFLYLFFAPISINMTRLTTGIELVDIFLYPYVLMYVNRKSNILFMLLLILLMSFLKFQSNMGQYPEIFSSYKTVFL